MFLEILKLNKQRKFMKYLVIPSLISLLSSSTLFAAPINPMENYTPTDISDKYLTVDRIWENLDANMKGKDCYKRAHIWSYDTFEKFGVKSKKIFIHYTNKWNYELDDLGGEKLYGGFLGLNSVKRKGLDYDGVSKRNMSVIKSNKRWVYHVATTIVDNKKDVVLDRTLRLAYDAVPGKYTDNEAWDLKVRPSTPEEWMEGLTIRGEILWKIRKAKLKEEIIEAKNSREVNKLKDTMKKLGMIDRSGNEVSQIDIKCKKATTITEADINSNNEWCIWTEAPMYYWNEIDLRYLAYGNTGYRYNVSPPLSVQNESNYRSGQNYIQTSFDLDEVEMSQSERRK